MALCAVCLSVPFASLPEPLAHAGFFRIGDNSDLPVLTFRPSDNDAVRHDSEGFPWHADLGALASSAQSCAICTIVQTGVEQWMEQRETALQNKFYVVFSDTHGYPIPTENRLILTKRSGGAPGFLVYVKSTHRGETTAPLLTGVAFSVAATHELAQIIPVRPLVLDSGSKEGLSIASSLLKNCQDGHDQCSWGEAQLPSRILDLGDSGQTIKLLETTEEQCGKYASLSYCWGETTNFTTSSQSIDARQSGIQLSDLPRTFFDAVQICRYIGIRYLWIDSLCICQDDAEDWARQSARMMDVYSNACLVIAANHASNSAQGIFHMRSPRPSALIDVPGYGKGVHAQLILNQDEHDWNRRVFEQEPLCRRGWALQERVIARRVLHYNTKQLYFECDMGVIGEDGSTQYIRPCAIRELRPKMKTWGSIFGNDYDLWNNLIATYGSRNLTKTTDKLPAMSGLATIFRDKLQAKYIAGLWDKALIEGLAWQGLGKRGPQAATPDEYIGPSWSWASYAGVAATGLRRGWKSLAEILDWHVELKTEANPYGEIQGAWLRIRGPIVPLFTVRGNASGDEDYESKRQLVGLAPHPRMRTAYSDDDTEGHIITLDYNDLAFSGGWESLDLQVLLLGGYKRSDGADEQIDEEPGLEAETDEGSHYGLVIAKADTDQSRDEMKRVGWTFLPTKEAERIRREEANWQTVVLV